MLGRERVGERLHGRERRVTATDAIDAGERIRGRSRRTAAGGCEEGDEEGPKDEGQEKGG
jgi:hypothetical protein